MREVADDLQAGFEVGANAGAARSVLGCGLVAGRSVRGGGGAGGPGEGRWVAAVGCEWREEGESDDGTGGGRGRY